MADRLVRAHLAPLWLARLVLVAALGLAAPAIAQTASANTIATSYGRGWECTHGFSDWGGACRKIEPPPNAYLNAGGERWECDRGFARKGTLCIARVPAR